MEFITDFTFCSVKLRWWVRIGACAMVELRHRLGGSGSTGKPAQISFNVNMTVLILNNDWCRCGLAREAKKTGKAEWKRMANEEERCVLCRVRRCVSLSSNVPWPFGLDDLPAGFWLPSFSSGCLKTANCLVNQSLFMTAVLRRQVKENLLVKL